jgi:hypothetical protein
MDTGGSFLREEVKQTKHEDDHSPACITEIKNSWALPPLCHILIWDDAEPHAKNITYSPLLGAYEHDS